MDFDEMNRKVMEEFHANEGRVGGYFEGHTLLLLHTTGARSGEVRVRPLVYLPGEGGRVYVIASKGGAPDNPDWYHNLRANPEVTMEFGTETTTGFASEVTDRAERDRLYAAQVARMPGFADYEKSTTRLIPVIAIDPA